MSVVEFKKEYKFNLENVDACTALAERGLKVVNGHMRLNAFLQFGGTAQLIDAKKSWEVSVKDGEMTVVVSPATKHTKPGVLTIMVMANENAFKEPSLKEPSWYINPKDITPSPFNQRTDPEDETPSP